MTHTQLSTLTRLFFLCGGLVAASACGESDTQASDTQANGSGEEVTATSEDIKAFSPLSEVSADESGVLELTISLEEHQAVVTSDNGDQTTATLRTFTHLGEGGTAERLNVMRVPVGGELKLTLENNLPPNAEDCPDVADTPNYPHKVNSINFHTHGLHVPPTGDGDNSHRVISPGDSVPVHIYLPPHAESGSEFFHNPGTHWFHSHKHGGNHVAFMSALAGVLILEDHRDASEAPPLGGYDYYLDQQGYEERVLLIHGVSLDDDADGDGELEVPEPKCGQGGPGGLYDEALSWEVLVNFIENPSVTMKPGAVEHWRIINGTTKMEFNLDLGDLIADGFEFAQIARDGIAFEEVVSITELDFTAGNRVDILVKAPESLSGSVALEYAGTGGPGGGSGGGDLLSLTVSGEAESDTLISGALPHIHGPDDLLPDFCSETVDASNAFTFTVANSGLERFLIEGKAYDHSCVDVVMERDQLVEWWVYNGQGPAHPFHIHTNAFQVCDASNGKFINQWMDTVPLPANGWVRLRMRLDDFVGAYMFHCHFIDHEDLGMMMNVVIVDDAQSERLGEAEVNELMAQDLGADASLQNMLFDNPSYEGFYTRDNFGPSGAYRPQCSFPDKTPVP